MCFGESRGLFETVMSFMLGVGLMWMIVVRTAGGAITAAFGHLEVIRPVVMHIHHSTKRKELFGECREQWVGDELDQFGQRYLCVKRAYEVAHPGIAPTNEGREVEGALVGARGPLGFYIAKFFVLRDIEPKDTRS